MEILNNLNNFNNKVYKENKINVVMIYGSPRRDGNTDKLMKRFKEGLQNNININLKNNMNIDEIFIKELKISPCIECRNCSINGECSIKDEMQNIYPKLINCNFIVVSSPVFFTSVSGFLKSFIDRCQRFWALKYELNKNIFNNTDRKGIFISTAGSSNQNIFECPKKVIRSFFDVLNILYYKDFLYNNVDLKDDILKNPGVFEDIFYFAKTLNF